jgi:prephenate dehydrogenase
MKRSLGVVGYGDFSKLLIRYLHPYFNIVVSTRQKDLPDNKECRFVSTREALAQPLVIPSMPSQYLEGYFEKNARELKPGTLVIDVCSVKVKPVQVLERVLPAEIDILATHPLFGPASAAKDLAGRRIMLYPVRISDDRYKRIKNFLHAKFRLEIIECTPKQHDEYLAYVQGLSHYIGRVMQIMDIPDTELMTDAYEDLLDMKRIQGGDSWELFESIMQENPFAKDVHDKFEAACKALDNKLKM